jgi:hypothetical protein
VSEPFRACRIVWLRVRKEEQAFARSRPASRSLLIEPDFVRRAGNRPLSGVQLGLAMEDELAGANPEFVGVFHLTCFT